MYPLFQLHIFAFPNFQLTWRSQLEISFILWGFYIWWWSGHSIVFPCISLFNYYTNMVNWMCFPARRTNKGTKIHWRIIIFNLVNLCLQTFVLKPNWQWIQSKDIGFTYNYISMWGNPVTAMTVNPRSVIL